MEPKIKKSLEQEKPCKNSKQMQQGLPLVKNLSLKVVRITITHHHSLDGESQYQSSHLALPIVPVSSSPKCG
jgi:hypothetical protein